MYIVVVYDVEVARVNNLRLLLRRYLNWVQNSVFEGEINEANLERLKLEIKEIIDKNKDSVCIYLIPNKKILSKLNLGLEKNQIDNIV